MFRATKDPNADLDYTFDWTAWLQTDSIVTSTWSVPTDSGLVSHDPSVDATGRKTTTWLSGGIVKSGVYIVTNHITTAADREEDRSIWVTVAER